VNDWEVYALRYAVHQDRVARENFTRPTDLHDAPMPMDYFFWVLRHGRQVIVVDTGFSPEVAKARKRPLTRTVADALTQLGVEPGAVEDVIVTHLHHDHAGNLDLFPKARFHLQQAEMAFATGRFMGASCIRYAFDIEDVVRMVRAVYAERVTFHDGDGEVAPGVCLHKVGGHTGGMQMVSVSTQRGRIVLASDACHYYANMQQQNPFVIVFDLGQMIEGWRLARQIATSDDHIVPGHDPQVRTRYPVLAGSEGETVCLHLPPG
jgi:glyoxylase-like metal-dependent hydrolase (beta-lactamase superfamily II)